MQSDIAFAYSMLQEEVEPLLFLARNLDLQRQALRLTRDFIDRADQERLSAILANDQHAANQLLGLGAIGRALASELEMYILLKEDRSEMAWDKLIDAQDQVSSAARASPSFTNLENKFHHLRSMESWFFPPQVFMSAGFIVKKQQCSICQNDYERCDHIAGRPYMGRFCNLVLKEISADHVAYVEAPADRRCRVISFKVPGGTRNRMTWVVTPEAERASGNMSAIIAVASEPEDRAGG